MPRKAAPGGEDHLERQRIYRENLKDRRVPEVGKVDRALSEALAIYFKGLSDKNDQVGMKKVSILEILACASLVSEGYDQKRSLRCIRRRVRRDDLKKLFDKVDRVSAAFSDQCF